MKHKHICKCGWTTHSDAPVATRCMQCGKEIKVGNVTSRGLGDTIHKITSALHIPHCGGCEQRRETLNNWFPYK